MMPRTYREPSWMGLLLRGERLFWRLFALVGLATLAAVIWLLN
ncbi:MAG: hypothetical protein JWP92_3539 [Caulobacter sp.]|jgi:hypothetical protein|nr:hypothetical protein [Caulobacter sp.]